MSTTFHYLPGTIYWAKRALDQKYSNWTIDLYPTDEAIAELKRAGMNPKLKEDREGKKYLRFRRPESRIFKGEVVKFAPPMFLILKDGKIIDYDGIIGNGSKGQVKVSVYDTTTYGRQARYESVLVEDLVEYTAPADAPTTSGSLQTPPF